MKYTAERNIQILIYLLKEHGIKKVIASPGALNISLVASISQDPFFEIYSSVDERSAAYIACGLAAESGEPVVLSCTGATASRNYLPGLTEAFYRKLPVLAVTATPPLGRIGHNIPQVIDRTASLRDTVKLSVEIPEVYDEESEWTCSTRINKAILELKRNGGGPVHINLVTTYNNNFDVNEIKPVNVISRILDKDNFPSLENKKVCIFVGAHKKWSQELTEIVDGFCERYNAAVLCDHTSNYCGKYKIMASLVTSQELYVAPCTRMDVLVHIGDISGAYLRLFPKEVWRVNPDGEIRDTFRTLRFVFDMEEEIFFKKYIELSDKNKADNTYYNEWISEYNFLKDKIPDLPFSNIWIAQQTVDYLPVNSVIHFGILNSLRSWNFFEKNNSILGYANTGGFGIDGCVSSLIGASLADPNKLYFGVVGDLAFFYDMNSLGNRHVGKNIRLMVINNGRGVEFRNYGHRAYQFGDHADKYIAAAGHYGNQSQKLIKDYSENLGFEYLSAKNKDEFMKVIEKFTTHQITEKPILLEVFTNYNDESEALKIMYNLRKSSSGVTKKIIRNVISDKGIQILKKIIK
jgi:Thiamine pyrophosphate enzyme, N-terminal TPP binding domain.